MAVERIVDLIFRLKAIGQQIPDRLVDSLIKLERVANTTKQTTGYLGQTLGEVVKRAGMTSSQFLRAAEQVSHFLEQEKETIKATQALPKPFKKSADELLGFTNAAGLWAKEFKKTNFEMEQAVHRAYPDLIASFGKLHLSYDDIIKDPKKALPVMRKFAAMVGQQFPRMSSFYARALDSMRDVELKHMGTWTGRQEAYMRWGVGLLKDANVIRNTTGAVKGFEKGLVELTDASRKYTKDARGMVDVNELIRKGGRAADPAKRKADFWARSKKVAEEVKKTIEETPQIPAQVVEGTARYTKALSEVDDRVQRVIESDTEWSQGMKDISEKFKVMGHTFYESTAPAKMTEGIFSALAEKSAKLGTYAYNLSKGIVVSQQAMKAFADNLVRTGGKVDGTSKKLWDLALHSTDAGVAWQQLTREVGKQVQAQIKATGTTDIYNRRLSTLIDRTYQAATGTLDADKAITDLAVHLRQGGTATDQVGKQLAKQGQAAYGTGEFLEKLRRSTEKLVIAEQKSKDELVDWSKSGETLVQKAWDMD